MIIYCQYTIGSSFTISHNAGSSLGWGHRGIRHKDKGP
jgi:hypothetical protein